MSARPFTPVCEADRVSRPAVRAGAIAFVVFTVVSTLIAIHLLHRFTVTEPLGGPPPSVGAQAGIVEQTLIDTTRRGLDDVDAKRRALGTWGWVDRDHGVARIPIDRAMDLVAASHADHADGGT